MEQEQIHEDVISQVIKYIIPEKYLDVETKIFINPTGRFVIGGPQGDSGLTGRKIIVDTYGGFSAIVVCTFQNLDIEKYEHFFCSSFAKIIKF